jgi:hypothetical protein
MKVGYKGEDGKEIEGEGTKKNGRSRKESMRQNLRKKSGICGNKIAEGKAE